MAIKHSLIKKGSNMVIVFPIENQKYGIFIDQIREVVPTPNIARIPDVPAYILGVANIRGRTLPVIDLAAKMLDKFVNQNQSSHIMVAESAGQTIGILISELPATHAFYNDKISEAPDLIKRTIKNKNMVIGVVEQKDALIVLIDVFEVTGKIEIEA